MRQFNDGCPQKWTSNAKAIESASAIEAADRDTKALKSSESMLKKLHSHAKSKDARPCFRCNQSAHSATACKFKEAECHACGKKGHIAPACSLKNKGGPVSPPNPPRQGKSSGKQHKAHQIRSKETTTGGDSSSDEYFLHKLGEKLSPIKASFIANGKPLEMEVDSGADISIISKETRKALFPPRRFTNPT